MVQTTGHQLLLILTKKKIYILRDILENNLQFVIVELSHGARFDCVVDNFCTEHISVSRYCLKCRAIESTTHPPTDDWLILID